MANIFVGFHEERLNVSSRQDILLYHQYVDDTSALENEKENTNNNSFLEEVNRLLPALEFTCEKEDDNKLPFMDVHVHKQAAADGVNINFETTVFRKATFTGVYTHWNSFTAHRYKTNLIRCLVNRAVKICSSNLLGVEVLQLKDFFSKNGYPVNTVNRSVEST